MAKDPKDEVWEKTSTRGAIKASKGWEVGREWPTGGGNLK